LTYWPAIEFIPASDPDLALAVLDDFSPSAVEERAPHLRVFFSNAHSRDAALTALVAAGLSATPLQVDDEDWARRSQQNLEAVIVGRLVVTPPGLPYSQSPIPNPQSLVAVTIQPSMGFGTGHHATTRLCLASLQEIDIGGKSVLDIGTGSGVLAIAAVLLGASRALGIDTDPDAIQAASENLPLNPTARPVTFEAGDFRSAALSAADVVVANLTGALLARSAARLIALVAPGGTLVVSGLLVQERAEVASSLGALHLDGVREEDGWLALVYRRPGATGEKNVTSSPGGPALV
jgi:ribosomal protein L11 methyltransferase